METIVLSPLSTLSFSTQCWALTDFPDLPLAVRDTSPVVLTRTSRVRSWLTVLYVNQASPSEAAAAAARQDPDQVALVTLSYESLYLANLELLVTRYVQPVSAFLFSVPFCRISTSIQTCALK